MEPLVMEPLALGRLAVQPFWSRSYRHFRIRCKAPGRLCRRLGRASRERAAANRCP